MAFERLRFYLGLYIGLTVRSLLAGLILCAALLAIAYGWQFLTGQHL